MDSKHAVILAVCALLGGGAFWAVSEPEEPSHTGRATIVDGDTLKMNGETYRLAGIDAVEAKQTCGRSDGTEWPCGAEATAMLRDFVGGREVTCEVQDRDRYRRFIATCFADGRDLGRYMVRKGMAIAYRKYAQTYVPDENTARFLKIGIWSGSFDRPEDWRRQQRKGE